MKPEVDLWERYGPLFSIEEKLIFPPDHRELQFYGELRKRHRGSCMEIGAGDGRLAGVLGSDSLTVGLEPSASMFELWTPDDRERVRCIRGLGQQLPLLESSLDFILFPYNGIHCILDRDDRRNLLSEVARVLHPRGKFFAETCPRFDDREDEENVERYHYRKDGFSLRLVETVSHDREKGIISFDMEYSGSSVPEGTSSMVLELALISAGEFLHDIREAGLNIVSIWGDYDYSPWDKRYSPRLLILAERSDT
ncbi:MAG: class I SAM-dependent methyltransferase [Candidatus Aegiribacteria sp.]|nr:class I SAM-dependent methyltransferase [Candidatus Aegiribacteria sp.]